VLANPFKAPTKDEFALFEAHGVARMSAEPGRQVGAALVNEQGEIIALRTNEVPRPGGGVYREGSNEPGIQTNVSIALARMSRSALSTPTTVYSARSPMRSPTR
jgi:deoxycytidylate deaminase